MRAVAHLFAAFLLASPSGAVEPAARSSPRSQIRVPLWADGAVKLSDLKASLDGSPAKILGVHGPDEGLLVLVVFDLVGDIALVNPARESLIGVLKRLPERSYVGLLRAQDGLKVLLDPTADRGALAGSIDSLAISGRPGLLDTVEQAEQLADSLIMKTGVRLAVLYITDSDIYDYREDYTNPVINSSDQRDLSRRFPEGLVREKISKLQGRLALLQAPLFIAHLHYQRDRLNEAYQTGLLQLAEVTGGTAIFCRSIAEVPSAIDSIFGRITSHWGVDLELPPRPSQNVQVLFEGGPGLTYRTRFLIKER